MRIFIKHRPEAQAIKILEQEKAEEYFQYLIEFGEPEDAPSSSFSEEDEVGQSDLHAIHEADECFHWISGQYTQIEELGEDN